MSKTPAAKIEAYFPIVAAIWRNEGKEGRAWYSVTIERRYKDDAGAWQSTGSFGADDLLVVGKVANLAHTEVFRLMGADRQAQREPGQEG
jgi:hypothetical protein